MDWLLGLENAYDVMGLAPDATDEEIEAEYEMLVRRKGYRVGLRRSSWRQRLSEIKAAYATLSDPVKRRAYDRSLGIVSDPPVWQPGSRSDEFSDALVRPAPAWQRASRSAESRAGAPTSVWPEERRNDGQEAEQFDDVAEADEWSASRPNQRKAWATGAALALGLSAILLISWQQQGSPEQSTANRPQSLVAVAPAKVASVPQGLAPAATAELAPNSELTPEEQAAAAGDARAASASLSQWLGKADAPADEMPAVLGTPAAKTGAEMAAASPVSEAPSQVATQAPATPTATNAPAPAAAPATQPQSVAPPPPVAAPQVESKISVALPPKAEAVSAPKLISGAPSDADNRRGKYRGSLVVQFTIGREGRVTNCAVRRTSGDAKLDALTCRILEARTRFAPAKDAQGTAVSSVANATYVWGRGHRAKK